MAKNFGQLRTDVQTKTPPHADAGVFLNDAQDDLVRGSKRRRILAIAVTAGTFNLPADCLFVRGVVWQGRNLDEYPGPGTPVFGAGTPPFYYKTDNNLGVVNLFPAPATGNAELIYCPRPTAMVNDVDMPGVQDADNALVAYAKWQIYTRIEDAAAAAFWRDQYYMTEMPKWMSLDAKQNRQPRRIRYRES